METCENIGRCSSKPHKTSMCRENRLKVVEVSSLHSKLQSASTVFIRRGSNLGPSDHKYTVLASFLRVPPCSVYEDVKCARE